MSSIRLFALSESTKGALLLSEWYSLLYACEHSASVLTVQVSNGNCMAWLYACIAAKSHLDSPISDNISNM